MQPTRAIAALLLVTSAAWSGGCASAPPARGSTSNTTVSASDFENPNESIESVLQRKVPGVVVRRLDDGSISLRLRGVSSYKGVEAAPLYILDDAPFQTGAGGALTGIDPYTIQTIKVLRGPEASLYGIEGANGVILITTKRPGARRR